MTLDHERDLSNLLEDEYGCAAMPSGASGAATERARPDVVAARDTEIWMIEQKSWMQSGPTGQLSQAEVEALINLADRAGGTPLIAVRPNWNRHDGWHLYVPGDLARTKTDNYSVRQEHVPGWTVAEVFGDE
jgi:Holliday junction resolvase